MSDETKNSDAPEPETEAPSSEAPSGTPETSPEAEPKAPEPRTLRGAGLRYGETDDVPSWARGKSADEIVEMADAMYQAFQRGEDPTPSQPYQETPTNANPTPPSEPVPGSSVDPNLLYSDPQAYTQAVLAEAKRQAREELQREGAGFVTPIATMARTHAQTYQPDVWEAYGPEIDAVMAKIPPQNRADVALWRQAVDVVAGKHYKELARREAERLRSVEGDTGMLPTNGGPPSPKGSSLSPIRRLFADRDPAVEKHLEAGLTAEDVIAQAQRMGHDESKYAEMLTRKASAVGGAR